MRYTTVVTEEKMTAQKVYERQRALALARETEHQTYDDVYWETPKARRGDVAYIESHPLVAEARAATAKLETEVADLQAEVGGKVYRVVAENLDGLKVRVEKLNKKAAKLGVEPIKLTITDEVEEEVTERQLRPGDTGYLGELDIVGPDTKQVVYTWRYVVIDGQAPQVPGYVFIATLDHTIQSSEDDPVTISRVPALAYSLRRAFSTDSDEATAAVMESIDLTQYRRAPNRCDHCGYIRNRNQTYVVYEVEGGKTLQVGSTCLRDYTGANDPHRAAAYAEYLAVLDEDLTLGGSADGLEGGSFGRTATLTLDYLANVSAVSREDGYRPRWRDYERMSDNTADAAHRNIADRGKYQKNGEPKWTEVTDDDYKIASEALAWVRELGERDDADLDEFEHNLMVATRSDYMPEKGDGFVAYTIQGYRKATEQEIERKQAEEAVKDSDYIAEVGDRIELSFMVTFTREFESQWGSKYLVKGVTPDGDRVTWWSTSWMPDQGETVTGRATVKAHETDEYNAGAKTTILTRADVDYVEEDQVPPGVTVVTSKKKREAAKTKRDAKKAEYEAEKKRLAENDREARLDDTWNNIDGVEVTESEQAAWDKYLSENSLNPYAKDTFVRNYRRARAAEEVRGGKFP